MAEYELGAREPVEYAGDDQPQGVRGGFGRPLPDRLLKFRHAVEYVGHAIRIARMQVERNGEVLQPFPEHVVARVVEIDTVGMAVDQPPLNPSCRTQRSSSAAAAAAAGSCMARWAKPA